MLEVLLLVYIIVNACVLTAPLLIGAVLIRIYMKEGEDEK